MARQELENPGCDNISGFIEAISDQDITRNDTEILPAPQGTTRKKKRPSPDDRRTPIHVHAGRIAETVDALMTALARADAGLYQRGAMLVLLTAGIVTPGLERDSTAPMLVPVTPAMVRDLAERHCRFSRSKVAKDGSVSEVPCDLPRGAAEIYLTRLGSWGVPHVRGIAEHPVMLSDGRIVYGGLDIETGVLVVAPGQWPDVPTRPSREIAQQALYRLMSPFAGFPSRCEDDRAVILTACITAVLRPTLSASPAFGFDATAPGTGKSKLATCIGVLATGRTPTTMSWGSDNPENEKRLGAALLAGDAVISIDNIDVAVKSAALNSAISEPMYSVRILGQSLQIAVPSTALILLNGNQLSIAGDLTRRILVAQLDAKVERPELRTFDFDPVAIVRRDRRELIAAALTVARYAAQQVATLGGFSDWARRVADPVIALDPLGALSRTQSTDPERELAAQVVTAWRSAFGRQAITVNHAVRFANSAPALRDALEEVAGSPNGISAKRIGKYLLGLEGRIVSGHVMRRGIDGHTRTNTWRAEAVE